MNTAGAVLVLLVAFGATTPGGEAMTMTVAQAVDAALLASPELLDAVDRARISAANRAGTRSLFVPQVTPFYDRTAARDGTGSQSRFGALLSQQFTFGPRLIGSVEAAPPADGSGGYASAYALELDQSLLRGLDPAVPREPLRAAERREEGDARSLAIGRRQTVVAAWSAYLNATLGEELVTLAKERLVRAERLVKASEAKLEAGSVSRLDVLRSEQLAASARSQENEARNSRDDAHDVLARLTGRPPGTRFVLASPERLPVGEPEEEVAIAAARSGREELLEQRSRVRDAETALRIAKSNVLPSLDAFAGLRAGGFATGVFDALGTPGKPAYTLGFRSRASLNLGLLLSQKAEASIALETARRAARVLEEDVVRAVRQSARRLRTAKERLAIDEANLEVATEQLEVANLRFEKGLSDNFHVVDAENLYNAARVSALTSRQSVLLARLDLLLVSALLRPEDFGSRK